MTEPTRYTCTVTPGEAPDRIEQVRALTDGLLSRERDGQQLRLRFDPSLATVVEAFVRDESRCCSFYEFDLERTEQAVELRVWAPPEAQELLGRLHDAFGPRG